MDPEAEITALKAAGVVTAERRLFGLIEQPVKNLDGQAVPGMTFLRGIEIAALRTADGHTHLYVW